MPDVDTLFRTAYQALIDGTPPAPEWEDVAQPVDRPASPRAAHPLPRRWGGLVVAGLLVAAVAGTAWLFSGAGDPTAEFPAVSPSASGPSTTEPADPAATPAVSPDRPVGEFVPVAVEASSSLPNFPPSALIDGDPDRAWNDDSKRGAGAWVRFTFEDDFHLETIRFENLTDTDRFTRNYRAARVRLETTGGVVFATLEDTREPQVITVEKQVRDMFLFVTDTYAAEPYGGQPTFDELAIGEVRFFGYPILDAASPAPLRDFRSTELGLGGPPGPLGVAATGSVWFTLVGDFGGEPAVWDWGGADDWGPSQAPVRPEEILASVTSEAGVEFATTALTGSLDGAATTLLRRTDGPGGEWQRVITLSGWIGLPVHFGGDRYVAPTYTVVPGEEQSGLLISDDAGASWTAVPFQIEAAVGTRIIEVAPLGDRSLAVGRQGPDLAAAVWLAGEPAGEWSRVNDVGLARFELIRAIAVLDGRAVIAGIAGFDDPDDPLAREALVAVSAYGTEWTVTELPAPDGQAARGVRVSGMEAGAGLAVVYGVLEVDGEPVGALWASTDLDEWHVVDLGDLEPQDVAISDDTVYVLARDASGNPHQVTARR